jgi:hypothetical protein
MRSRPRPRPAAFLVPAAAVIVVLAAGCTKRVAVGSAEVNIADGRTYELELQGDRSLSGRLVTGSTVRYAQGDSLFEAEVGDVTDEFIELSRRVFLVEDADWTPLRAAEEDAAAVVGRPELGGTLLARDEIQNVSVLTLDRRRMVTESLFWTALFIAAGFAAVQ